MYKVLDIHDLHKVNDVHDMHEVREVANYKVYNLVKGQEDIYHRDTWVSPYPVTVDLLLSKYRLDGHSNGVPTFGGSIAYIYGHM